MDETIVLHTIAQLLNKLNAEILRFSRYGTSLDSREEVEWQTTHAYISNLLNVSLSFYAHTESKLSDEQIQSVLNGYNPRRSYWNISEYDIQRLLRYIKTSNKGISSPRALEDKNRKNEHNQKTG